MKKIVQISLAILMVMCLALGVAACQSDCQKGNHDKYIVNTDAATCTTAKVEHWACNNCDWTENVTVGTALGHDYTNVNWTPSATDEAKHEKACTRCDYKETANHTTGAATCPDCGKELGGSVQPCTHPDKTFTTTAATCTTAEVKHWTCPDCDWTNDETVGEALGHNVTTWTPSETEGKHEGTCTREGCDVTVTADHVANADGTECTLCHATLGGGVEPHEHDYTGATWTATADGSKHQMTCTVEGCGHVKTEDHAPEAIKGAAATCTADGKEDGSKCSVCNHIISEGEVIPAIPHNYEGQAWKTASGKHYQECAYGCGNRNEHTASMGQFQKVGDNHVSACTVQGCSIKSEHEPDFGDWTITETSHYKQCTHSGCTFKTEVGDHNQDAIENKNSTQHTVACSACGKTYPDANHVWGEFAVTKQPTCTEEGIQTRTCACGATDTDTIDTIDHTEAYEDTDLERIVTCSVCHNELERITHVYELYDGDRQQHWEQCKTCKHIKESTREDHDYTTHPDEFVCSVCGRVPEGITVSLYYNDTYASKDTLADAIAAITDNTVATIYLGQDLQGAGIVVPENRNITLRMLGNTYTVTSAANGNNGIVLGKDSTVNILNGTITTAENSGVTTLVANYANLTLTNAILDGAKLNAVSDGHNYTLRSYFGTTSMTGSTIKAATATDYALDVLYGTASEYMDGVSVTVGASSVINGYVRYGSAVANADWSKVVLRLRSTPNYLIHFSCDDVNCDTANIKKVNTSTGEEAQLAHRKDSDWTHDETNVAHYHLCTRCGAHTDEASCELTKETVAGKPATCTASGLTDGQKCSVCGTTLVARTTINALGHDYDETIEGHVTISKAATCTEDGSKTVQCSRCTVTETRTIDALGHDMSKASETAATCTTALVEHWSCSRCDHTENKTVGNALGHDLSVASTDAATCTTAQINHMVCSRCTHTENQTVGEALGHDWATAWTAVDALQHAHLCQREGCNATNGATSHTYAANHCEACDRTITEAEILTALGKLGNGAYLCGKTSTFTLTGVITKVDYAYTESNGASVTMDVNGTSIYCFKMKGDDVNALKNLQVGDTITVLGNITNYQGNKLEFDTGCTLEAVTFANVTITWTKGEDVTVEGLVNEVARYTQVEFSVPHADNYNVIVKVNGAEIEANAEEKYVFEAKANTTVEIELQDANVTHPHKTGSNLEITPTALGVTGSYNTSAATAEISGVTFSYIQCMLNNGGIQMNISRSPYSSFQNTTALPVMSSISISYASQTNANFRLKIELANNANFDNADELDLSSKSGITEFNIASYSATYVRFTAAGSGAGYVTSIVIVCESNCSNTENFTHHDEKAPTCTEDGNIEYWTCDVCHKMFSDELCNTVITSVVDEAHKATGHSLTKVDANAPTCEQAGNVEHWICANDNCDAKFSDENGTTPIDEVTVVATGHKYTYTSNNNGTHTGICQNDNTHVDANISCTSETWNHDAANHWKVCDVCNVKFGETAHTGDECDCGALMLTYKVYNELYHGQNEKTELTLADGDLTVTMPTYAAASDTINVTATSTKYDVTYVTSGADFTKSSGVFSGAVAEGGIIEIYVKALSSAKYVGATVNGAKEGEISVTATVDDNELENNAVLAEGNVITIEIIYLPDDYDIVVVVTQGSSINPITLETDGEMTATGTYTCQAKGDVEITVTARAKYTVTIPTTENVTFTVTKVVEDGDDVTLSDGATVLVGDIIKVEAAPATNYQVVEGSLTVNGTETVTGGYKVIGDVTIEVELAKKVTVNITANAEADIEVTVDGEKVDGEIYVTGATTLTITVTVKEGVNKEVDAVTVDGKVDGVTASDGKYTYTIDVGATAGREYVVAATLKDKKEPVVVLTLTSSNFPTSYPTSDKTSTVDGEDGKKYDITYKNVMSQSSKIQIKKSSNYLKITGTFAKIEIKGMSGMTVKIGDTVISGTTANNITVYDLTGYTDVEIGIYSGSSVATAEQIQFYA